jgi:hypothetical protein
LGTAMPASAAARITEVPFATVTGFPSTVSETGTPILIGVPKSPSFSRISFMFKLRFANRRIWMIAEWQQGFRVVPDSPAQDIRLSGTAE